MIYIVKTKNFMTTAYYYEIIKATCERLDNTIVVDNYELFCQSRAKKNSLIVVGHISTCIRLRLKGFKNIIMWCQGIVPEERRMQGRSKLYVKLISFCEKMALKMAMCYIFVSKAEKEHFERKYNLFFPEKKYIIMPCFNEPNVHIDSFRKKEGRIIFAYTGGLGAWQCIDETLKLYKSIEQRITNVELLFLTNKPEIAVTMIEKENIKNYICKYVKVDELSSYLKNVDYGFVLRKKDPVNIVATPTKFSTYISNGIVPIYSSCISSFDDEMRDKKYKISLENLNLDECSNKIVDFMNNKFDVDEQLIEYTSVFENYYNCEKYMNELYEMIKNNYDANGANSNEVIS